MTDIERGMVGTVTNCAALPYIYQGDSVTSCFILKDFTADSTIPIMSLIGILTLMRAFLGDPP